MNNIKEFETFKNAYLAILFESALKMMETNPCPMVTEEDILYAPKTKNEFIKALKNVEWIYDNEKIDLLYNENIIYEAPGSMDYPGTLCDKIMSCKNFEKLLNNEVISYINKDWKYYNELNKKGKTITIFKFEFSDINDIKEKFCLPGLNENLKELYVSKFLNNSNAFGCIIKFIDLYVFCFNINLYTKKTILHEFTHYLQHILNVEIVKIKDDLDNDKLKFLNLTNNDLKIIIDCLKNRREIIPYVNEFCETVMDVFKEYQKLKKDLEWSNTFIEYFIKVLLNSEDIRNEELFKIYKKVSNNDMLPLYIALGCFIFEIDLNRIKKIMFEENKWID